MASGAAGAVARQIGRVFTSGVVAGLDEGQLLDRFVSRRDEAAFEALVARHGPMVLGVCRRLLRDPNDVDDAFQATFLVLVRKAGSLGRRDLLGNWLYGVAYRVAVRARAVAARRHAAEATSTGAEALAPARDEPGAARDLRADLHDEVHKLPASYRAPVVLCYLEGLTHEQAAEQLGWPVGTVKGRLSRARDLLRTRLTRRGLTLASGAAAVDLLARDTPAAVPEALVSITVRAAAHAAAGKALAAGAVSASAAALTKGVLHAMSLSRFKTLLVSAVVAAGVTTGAGVSAYQGFGPGPDAGDAGGKKAAPAPENKPKRTSTPDTYSLLPPEQARFPMGGEAVGNAFDAMVAAKVSRNELTADLVRRLFHWSRTVKEAQELLSNEPENIAGARNAHWERMHNLYKQTQVLKGPDQPAIADAGRDVFQTADRDMAAALPGSQKDSSPDAAKTVVGAAPGSGGMPAGPGPGMGGFGGGFGGGGSGGGFGGGFGSGGMGGGMGGAGGMGGGMGGRMMKGSGGGTGMGMTGPGMMPGGMAMNPRSRDRMLRTQIAGSALHVMANDTSPRSKAVFALLEEPVSFGFSNDTPLEDVLKYVKRATQGPKDTGIAIYLDPAGLQDAEKTEMSTVILDMEGVPLKTTLRLVLKQLGLAYCVRDGVIIISSPEGIASELMEAASADEARSEIQQNAHDKPAEKPTTPRAAPTERPQAK